jgi:hypothetical protein
MTTVRWLIVFVAAAIVAYLLLSTTRDARANHTTSRREMVASLTSL